MEPSRWGGPQTPERASPLALSSPAAGRKQHFCGILRKEPWGSFQAGRLGHAGQGGNCSPPMRMKQANRASSHAHLLSPPRSHPHAAPPLNGASGPWSWGCTLAREDRQGPECTHYSCPAGWKRDSPGAKFLPKPISGLWPSVPRPRPRMTLTLARAHPGTLAGALHRVGTAFLPGSTQSAPSACPRPPARTPAPRPRGSPGGLAVEGHPRPQDASSALASGRVGWDALGRAPRPASPPARSAASAACPEAGRDARAL